MSELVETLRTCASNEQIVRHYHVALAQRQEDEIEALRARLEKADKDSEFMLNSYADENQRLSDRLEKAEAERNGWKLIAETQIEQCAAARNDALEEALAAIASLPTGKSEDEMRGQEDGYRSVEALKDKS